MTDFTSVGIPKPKDWQALERHCRRLFELSFSDPAVQNNGRAGQPQHGVDIFGRRDGGKGRLVGIQCKGKDADYGGEVSKAELHAEVKKTQNFAPPIEEFILLTTAPNDQKIQRVARELELELKRMGRSLVIQVWGWERVQQEIDRFPEAIKEFHPDATPFTDQILDASEDLKRLVSEGAEKAGEKLTGIEQTLALVLNRLPPIVADISARTDALDKELHDQIDGYRDLLRRDKPRTALELLARLKDRVGPGGPQRIRYRLLSNIGAAHYNLGQYDQASDFLLEAAPLNPDDPGSLANKAAALLIKNRRSEAQAIVIDAINRFPESQELVLPRLQTLSPRETVESVWQSLSEKAKGTAMAFTFRLGSLREAGDLTWRRLAEEGCQLYPDDVGLKILRAESVIDRLLQSDPGAIGLMTNDTPSHSDFREAAVFLEKAWHDSMGQETPPKPVCGHNAALAWSILGEPKRATPILDSLIAAGFDGDDAKRLRVAVYRRQGETAEAIRLASQLSDSPMHRLLRADLEIDRSPTEARKLIKDQSVFVSSNDVIGAALVVAESYVKEGNFEAALAEARLLEAKLPGHPQGPLALFKVKKAQGSSDLKEDIYRAAALVTGATDFTSRFLVAEAFSSVQLFDETVDCLVDHTSRRLDSPALRSLVAAAASADRRVTLRKILLDMPQDLADEPFYAKAKIALAIQTGSIAEAENEIRAFLSRDPSNLELHIQLLQALFRQNKMEGLRTAVSIPVDRFKGSAFDFIKLAHFKDDFGDWREAHALAYRTLLSNPSSQAVTMGYIGVFLRPGHSRQLSVEAPSVESDVAVALKNEEGATTIYILEPDAALRPSAHYLPPDHAIAKLLFGKKIGDSVEMPDKSAATISWIKPKFLQALHDVMDDFPNRFPEAEGFERVKIDSDREGGLEPILERLRDRHEAAQQVGKLYESGAMTLSIVGKSLGCDPVEAMVGLASFGSPIRVCAGTHPERDKALAAIDANGAKGCVVDAVTLHVVRRLKIEHAVNGVCGPIHIVDETSLHLQRKIHELNERIDEPDMSLAYRDGQYYRTEITSEQKREVLHSLEADRLWLAENTTIVPAEGSRDPSPEWRPLIERFGSSFLDEIRAAEGAGLILLSEDQSLRALGEADYVVPAVWLQPVLMRALDLNLISEEAYRDAVVAMIDSRFQFISVTSQLLFSAVRGASGHVLPPDFEKLASKVGGKIAEFGSHASIAYRTAVAVWHDYGLTDTVKQAVVGRLLERLIDERSQIEVRAIVYGWVQLESERARNSSMITYIQGWLRGHFIVLD